MRGWREGPQRCWTHESTREASYKVERLTKRIRGQFQAVGLQLSSAVSFWSVGGRVCRGQKRNQTGRRGHPNLNWWTCPLVVATGNDIEDLEVYTPFVHTPTHSIEWKDEFTHKEAGGILRNEVMVSCLCTPTPINFSQLFQPAPRAGSKLPTLPNQPSTSMITPKGHEKAPLYSITLLPLEKVSTVWTIMITFICLSFPHHIQPSTFLASVLNCFSNPESQACFLELRLYYKAGSHGG